ncbi:BrnT family toxin [Microcoleus sp. herbarium14]|uniref:BrnT family toxin n=1 Tax=Microcoleus sp. herbarium14 TaxID=3055439 RepID=UPI002FD42AE4
MSYSWLKSLTIMEFEFDENKSKINQEKHGIDFVEAQQLWIDPNKIELSAKTEDEPRFMVIGKIGGQHWSAIITYRQTKIRLISVRRSRTNEVNLYES